MSKILLYTAIVLTLATAGLGYWNHHRYQVLFSTKQALFQEQQEKMEKMSSELQLLKSKMDSETVTEEQSKKEVDEVAQARDKALADLASAQQQLAAKDAELRERNNDLLAKEATVQTLTAQLKKEATVVIVPSSNKKKKEKPVAAVKVEPSPEPKSEALMDTSDLNVASGEGKVVAVNQTWNFVVINLGDHNGVINNSTMLVKRGSQLIAKVKISSVEPLTSVGDLVPKTLAEGFTIQVGDTIVPENSQ